MTVTEGLTQIAKSLNTNAVSLTPIYEPWTRAGRRRSILGSLYDTLTLENRLMWPVGTENGSWRSTIVNFPGGREEFRPRTALGAKLLAIRNRAIISGMPLLSEDEVLNEVKRRRGELENDEADIS